MSSTGMPAGNTYKYGFSMKSHVDMRLNSLTLLKGLFLSFR